jgi:hypothetical protein
MPLWKNIWKFCCVSHVHLCKNKVLHTEVFVAHFLNILIYLKEKRITGNVTDLINKEEVNECVYTIHDQTNKLTHIL